MASHSGQFSCVCHEGASLPVILDSFFSISYWRLLDSLIEIVATFDANWLDHLDYRQVIEMEGRSSL